MKIQLENSDIVSNTIQRFKKQELLSTNDVRTPQLHILPKIHKAFLEDQS